MNTTQPTYEHLCQQAQRRSEDHRWAAVVEIITYRTGTSRLTVACSSRGPIKSHATRFEFRGVMARFHDGQAVS